MPDSNEKHRRALAGANAFEGHLVEGVAQGGGKFFPDRLDSGAGFACCGDGVLEQCRIDSIDHLAQADGIGRAGEEIAAGRATATVDEPSTPQIVENLQ